MPASQKTAQSSSSSRVACPSRPSRDTLPLISVIIPVYDVKDYLPRCLDSVRAQTYSNLQIILIDDGSTDASARLCDIYAKLDSRAQVYHQSNAGLSAARNQGLELATGKYIYFLDSDDYLEHDCLEYLYQLLAQNQAQISFCSHYLFREQAPKAKTTFNPEAKYPDAVYSVEAALKNILNERGAMLSAWNKLYARELFTGSAPRRRLSATRKTTAQAKTKAQAKAKSQLPAIRFPVGRVHEDVGTTYRLFLRAYELNPSARVAFGAQAKYNYLLRDNSLSNAKFNLKKLDLILQTDQMCDELDQVFPDLQNSTNLRRLHARFSILRQLSTKTHKTERIKQLERSLTTFIFEHKSWIKANPEATLRDKMALFSLSFGSSAFAWAWRNYQKFRKL